MGGMGSGRRSTSCGYREDDFHVIDMKWLRRQGCFSLAYFPLRWSRNDRETASIGVTVRRDGDIVTGLELSYDCRGESYKYIVPVDWLPCYYGSARPYLLCPHCGRRALKLYGGNFFLCRRCQGFTYDSQYYDPWMRNFVNVKKLQEKTHKKWMRGRTWGKLMEKHDRYMTALHAATKASLQRYKKIEDRIREDS